MALAYFDDNDPNESQGVLMSGVSKLFGLTLLAISAAIYLMFSTYNVEDPSLLKYTANTPTNALGYLGSYLADPLIRLLGQAVWVLPLALVIWAVRLFMGWSNANFFNRMIFAPIALLVCSIFASTFSLAPDWYYMDAGMGGVFGDKILSVLMALIPFPNGLTLFILSILLGIFAVMAVCFISGIQVEEIFRFGVKVIDDLRYVFGLIFNRLTGSKKRPQNAGSGGMNAAGLVSKIKMPKRAAKSTADPNMPNSITQASAMQQPTPAHSHTGTLNLQSMLNAKSATPNAEPRIEPRVLQEAPVQDHEWEGTSFSADARIQKPQMGGSMQDIVSRKVSKHQEMLKIRLGSKKKSEVEPSAQSSLALDEPLSTEDQLMSEFGMELTHDEPQMPPRTPLVQTQANKKPNISTRAQSEAQPRFTFEAEAKPHFETPPLSLLQNPDGIERHIPPREALEASARQLEAVLDDYGVKGEIVAVRPGPVVTMYELEPAAGLKASRVIGLADDIARSMSALTARVATIPGRSVIGIELPNEKREMVLLREIFAAKNYGDSKLSLPLALGKDIAGEPVVTNLAKMPHLLIAGTTGSGKSVAINTMILSLLYHASPEDVRMIMIDPKMLELSVYDNIPHLLSPVVTDPKKAVVALKWVVSEMEERYRKMSKMGVRNIDGFNARVKEALAKGEGFKRTVQTGFDDATGEPIFETEEYAPEIMPYIVVVVDEMADLMMVSGKEIEACIQRLAQMARASGIHLIMATQRPSVDVITGTIKANFPTRISFQVTSKIDSRTILGEMGAEQLLGMGDMLYMSGGGRITRVHGPFVSDEEVEEVVNFLKSQGEPNYVSGVIEGPEDEKASDIDAVLGLGDSSGEDELYDQAVAIVARDRKCSTSYIQRKLSIGYNKAANLVERMEEQGVVSEANHVGKRDVLVPEV